MATTPLEDAIRNLTETLRAVGSGVGGGISGFRSVIGATPAGGTSLNIISSLTSPFKQLTGEIGKSVDLFRNFNRAISDSRQILTNLPQGQAGLKTILEKIQHPFVSQASRARVQAAVARARPFVARADLLRRAHRQNLRNVQHARRAFISSPSARTHRVLRGALANAARSRRISRRAGAIAGTALSGAAGAAGRTLATAGALSAISGVGAAVGAVVAFTGAVILAASKLRSFADVALESNRKLAFFSGKLSVTFAQLDLNQFFRNWKMATGVEVSTVNLAGAVNRNRDAWLGADIQGQNLQNNLAILGLAISNGIAPWAEGILNAINRGVEYVNKINNFFVGDQQAVAGKSPLIDLLEDMKNGFKNQALVGGQVLRPADPLAGLGPDPRNWNRPRRP